MSLFRRYKGLERKTHDDDGLGLLRELFTPEDLSHWETHRGVWVQGKVTKRWYFVHDVGIHICSRKDMQSLMLARCVIYATRKWTTTRTDFIIARAMLIRCNEKLFNDLYNNPFAIVEYTGVDPYR